MATVVKIWQKYVFGRLNDNNEIEYFVPKNGCLVADVMVGGKIRTVKYSTPTEAQMNKAGWYRVVNVEEEGTDYINDNILYHYIGIPVDEPIEDEEPVDEEPTEGEETSVVGED